MHGDAESVAELIRVYRTRYDAFDQPLFIGGESYGTTRAMQVAYALARRRTPLAGVILISGGYDAGQEVPRTLMQALQVPHFTATAHYHGRLPADLQAMPRDAAVEEATDWARNEYAPVLEEVDVLGRDQKQQVLARLERCTGVAARFVDPDTLVLRPDVVYDHLLDDADMELGRYDSRLKTARRDLSRPWVPLIDPSILPMIDMMQGTSPMVIRYLRDTLGYRTDMLYKGPFGEGFHPEPVNYLMGVVADDWMTLNWGSALADPKPMQEGMAPLGGRPALERAMRLLPDLRVYNAKGMYDGSCAAQEEAIARTDPVLRPRVEGGCYAAGHMVYTDIDVRRKLQADLKRFITAETPD